MEQFDALEVIARTRGKVEMDSSAQTGGGLFPLWGWLTVIFYTLAFVIYYWLHHDWALWLWIGIPVVGFPIMISLLRKDHERTHMRTHRSKLVLNYWIFAACAIGIGGFIFGFAGIYEMVENPLICLLVGIGSFVTGEVARFRPMMVGGITGAALGVCSFLLQGELWVWQMPCIVMVAIVALVIPGYLFKAREKNGV